MNLDTQLITNWVISGLIGLTFGLISAWATHRYERRRDEISWQREKEKLAQQLKQEKELVEIQFQQRLFELEKAISNQNNLEMRSSLIKGLENPAKEIKNLERSRVEIKTGGILIKVDTDEIRAASQRLKTQVEEMHSAIRNVEISIARLREMPSPRIQGNLAQWDEHKRKLIYELDAIEETAIFLKEARDELAANDS